MSRRWVIIVCVLIVALAAGLEWALRHWGSATTSTMIVNEGNESMQEVFATYADTRISLGTLAPGDKSKVWFSGAGRGPLRLDFTQKGNPLKGFTVEDFDPTEHRNNGSRLVLIVKSNQVERYVEEDDSVKSAPRMLDRLMDWIRARNSINDLEGHAHGDRSGQSRVMGETTRTFFAIEIPEPLGQELRRLQKTLAPELPGCRWTGASTPFHMTVAFLGEVRDLDSSSLHGLVAASVARFEPCELKFEGLGAFPSSRRANVVWAGLSARTPVLLEQIQQAVAGAANKAGYPPDDRFHPHVTLGRFKRERRGPCDVTAVMERYRSWSCGEFTAFEVVGFASRQTGDGPSY